jgi:ribosome maturation factor RimP
VLRSRRSRTIYKQLAGLTQKDYNHRLARCVRVTYQVGFVPTFYFGLQTMELSSINERVGEIALAAAAENGVDFVQSEILGTKRNPTVRVYIDKPEGVTLDDCSAVSRVIESVLDTDDLIPHSYTLEVSSPGLERGLFSLGDFARFTGRKVKIRTREDFDGRNSLNGKIAGIEGDIVILEDRAYGTIRIPFDAISKANLRVDLEQEFKRR